MIKAEVCTRAKWSTQPEPIPVSSTCSDNEYYCFPLDVMLSPLQERNCNTAPQNTSVLFVISHLLIFPVSESYW